MMNSLGFSGEIHRLESHDWIKTHDSCDNNCQIHHVYAIIAAVQQSM